MAERMRLFIAIDVPEPVRGALVGAQQSLRERSSARLRWTRPDAMHLTLKFLGDVDAARLPPIARAMAEVAGRHHPFGLSVTRLGAFPGGRRLQVVWAGIEGDLQAMGALRDALEAALAAEGHAAEARAFRPHVTLGRTRGGMRPDEAERISAALPATALADGLAFSVERIVLYRSHLGAGGSRYEALAAAELSGTRILT